MSHFHSVFFAVTAVITSVSATEYKVGGPAVGWRLPPINDTKLYNVWASRRRFYVGDSLRFVYGYDSLVVVEKWGFYHCDSRNPVAFYNDGETVIYLDKVGPMYFMSGVPDNCKQGLNMEVEVMNRPPVIHNPPPAIPNPPPAIPSPPEKTNPPTESKSGLPIADSATNHHAPPLFLSLAAYHHHETPSITHM
ncbi:hypothetical protein SSX86_002389 [Deinandra increscens subsp. villosa]|uniref:Phytocyanin domain-containing protein n=1 Tax=Deinandra increscens subsp. villosa TaxID=3103831 RepID=A0AAP0DTC9_9ASTR